ncbi:type VI secretion system contractile sheath large subunit [Corallococcus sp. BB11-1]|uniref:type VI secretion system contractile sheath large subunit n=1 Tax=Corallococcus sp. BB11-1 TaxID=2996783 RepID=UPI0022705E8F|nr:type VI secretion system contractile sheath large subunit [Corallococcus sp. BB11-1]MCY1033887.1 type VI secretion system contractile sheath large subunit [Corallococcus sp. BB11-1]
MAVSLDSGQHWLDRNRPPRVQITYDLETAGAIEKKELPLVVGILADLCVQKKEGVGALPPLKERKFVQIDRDNFNDLLKKIGPKLKIKIANKIEVPSKDGKFVPAPLSMEMDFSHIDDFRPASVVKNASFGGRPLLKELRDQRQRLVNLVAKLDGNDKLADAIDGLKKQIDKVAGKPDEIAKQKEVVIKQLEDLLNYQCQLASQPSASDPTPPNPLPPPPTPPKLDEPFKTVVEKMASGRIVRDLKDKVQFTEQLEGAKGMVRTFVEHFLEDAKYTTEHAELRQNEQLKYDLKNDEQKKKWETYEKDSDQKVQSDMVAMLSHRIALIDLRMGHQLDEILHHPDFQQLEASWRGLHYLVMRSETGPLLKLRVLNVSQNDLLEDLDRASDFDQSTLFKKVYEEEYGTFGGNPFSLLLGDFQFTNHPQHIKLLQLISNVAAAAHAPFIAAATPALFGLEDFTALDAPRDLSKVFESSEYIAWRSFRGSEDSRYVTLTLPRFLLRLPYGRETVPVDEFDYNEDASKALDPKEKDRFKAPEEKYSHHAYLWGNPAYALGARITASFALYGWCAAIRGVENGGQVENLPLHFFKSADGERVVKIPTESSITDRREKELSDLGFLALCYRKEDNRAVFFGSQTVQKPRVFDTPQATANASISSQLPYMLAASRFAHYLKVLMRDKIGSYMTKDGAAVYLNRWISAYVQLNDEAAADIKARQPLREARIDVFDIPGKPGSYRSVVFLRPHFQLNELTASIRLVAELPKPAA